MFVIYTYTYYRWYIIYVIHCNTDWQPNSPNSPNSPPRGSPPSENRPQVANLRRREARSQAESIPGDGGESSVMAMVFTKPPLKTKKWSPRMAMIIFDDIMMIFYLDILDILSNVIWWKHIIPGLLSRYLMLFLDASLGKSLLDPKCWSFTV